MLLGCGGQPNLPLSRQPGRSLDSDVRDGAGASEITQRLHTVDDINPALPIIGNIP